MARVKATISQPGIKARRTIFGVAAEIGGTVARARRDLVVQLRAELRNGRLSAGIIEKVNAKFTPTSLKAKSSKLSSGAKVNKSIPLVSDYGVGFSLAWILKTGYWNDEHPWVDTEKWKDN